MNRARDRRAQPAQEMELEEPGHAVEMGVAREPHVFERALGALHDLEAIHGNIHGDFLLRWGCAERLTRTSLRRDKGRNASSEAVARKIISVTFLTHAAAGSPQEQRRAIGALILQTNLNDPPPRAGPGAGPQITLRGWK
jgi:hypothetical protein